MGIKQLPYGVQTDKKILHEADLWCQERWGSRWEAVDNREGSWCVFWAGSREYDTPYTYQWWFKTEQQSLLFSLRWV